MVSTLVVVHTVILSREPNVIQQIASFVSLDLFSNILLTSQFINTNVVVNYNNTLRSGID